VSAELADMKFDVEERLDRDEWERVLVACDHATFFHSPLWHDAIAGMTPATEVSTLCFSFDDDESALLPVLKTRTLAGRVTRYQSGPAMCYGGWIGTAGVGTLHGDAIARWLHRNMDSFRMRVNPYGPVSELWADDVELQDSTQLIDLSHFTSDEELRASYRYSVRKHLKKAERAGMVVRESDGARDWDAHYRLYEKALERWGTDAISRYPSSLFEQLRDQGGDRVRLWVAEMDGKVVGANLNFYQGGHAVEWHAAFDEAYFKHGVRVYLVHRIIDEARMGGYQTYDFNPSGGIEGTRKFKETYQPQSVPAPIVRVESRRYSIARRILGRSR